MSDWEVVSENPQSDWEVVMDNKTSPQKSSLGSNLKSASALPLGLAQWASDWLSNAGSALSKAPNPTATLMGVEPHEYGFGNIPAPQFPEFDLGQYSPEGFGSDVLFNIGRYGPDVAALGTPLIKGALKLSSKNIGNKIVKDFKDLKSSFKKEYGDFFDEAEKKGINKIPHNFKNNDIKYLRNVANPEQEKLLMDFIDNPSFKRGHELQSDLGKIKSELSLKQKTKGLDAAERKALKSASKLQEELKNDLYKELMAKGGLELPFKYMDIGQRYGKNLGPYLDSAAIRKAALKPTEKGAIQPKRLLKKLQGERGDPFLAAMSHKYPEINTRYKLGQLAKTLGLTSGIGGIGGIGYGVYKSFGE